MRDDLDRRLLAAHAADDRSALITLYTEAAEMATQTVARNFFLTHAYVFALEAGLAVAADLRARLVAFGAETAE